MGLLDDAIRDHLELKRRRGADPAEVAREQREALEPLIPGPQAEPEGDEAVLYEDAAAAGPVDDAPSPLSEAAADGAGAVAAVAEPDAGRAQETAELDMEAVLDEVTALSVDGAIAADESLRAHAHAREDVDPDEASATQTGGPAGTPDDEDSLEWETPGEASSG